LATQRGGESGPATAVGRWLAAILCHDHELRDRLVRYVPANAVGLLDDEKAVVAELCSLVASRYFGPGYEVGTVTEFARWMQSVWVGRYQVTVMQIEGVIRAALGETKIDLSGMEAPALSKAQLVAASKMSSALRWELATVEGLVCEAEVKASRKGWHPRQAVA
jgi:hypothetical protein